jgi:hypothetical protein
MDESIRDQEEEIESERAWLSESKGRRVVLNRLGKELWRDRSSIQEQKLEHLKSRQKAVDEQAHWTKYSRARITHCKSEIKRIKQVKRDLLVRFAVLERQRWPHQRVPSYKDIRLVLEGDSPSLALPRSPFSALIRNAFADIHRPGGVERWPLTAELLPPLDGDIE